MLFVKPTWGKKTYSNFKSLKRCLPKLGWGL